MRRNENRDLREQLCGWAGSSSAGLCTWANSGLWNDCLDLLVGDNSVFRTIPRKETLKLKSHTFSLRNLPSKASAHPRRDHRDSRWSLHLMDAPSKQALKVPGKLLTGNVSSEN